MVVQLLNYSKKKKKKMPTPFYDTVENVNNKRLGKKKGAGRFLTICIMSCYVYHPALP